MKKKRTFLYIEKAKRRFAAYIFRRTLGEAAMNLGDEDMYRIGEYVKAHIIEWLPERVSAGTSRRELDLIERVIRVEKELKNLGIRMDERFKAVQKQMDVRFEAVQKQMDERFDQSNKRFSSMQWFMAAGFTILPLLMSAFQYL